MRIPTLASRTIPFRWIVLAVVFSISAGALFAADIDGAWAGQFASSMNPNNVHKFVLDLKADGAKLNGTIAFCHPDCTDGTGKLAIKDGKIDGNTISFGIDTDASDVPHIDFEGKVNGDSISFAVDGTPAECGGSECQIAQGSATRKKL